MLDTLRAHTSDPADTHLRRRDLCCFWGFNCFGYIHLSGFVLLSRPRPAFLIGRWRKWSALISAATPPHTNSKCTYSVSETDRQTSLLNTAAWWSKPIDHPISSPINHLLSFTLSPTNPPSRTISPLFVPSLPTSFSLYAFAFNPSLKSRSTKRPNLYHSRHQPKTVK